VSTRCPALAILEASGRILRAGYCGTFCVNILLQARFKDKGSEIASEQLSQVLLIHNLLTNVFVIEVLKTFPLFY